MAPLTSVQNIHSTSSSCGICVYHEIYYSAVKIRFGTFLHQEYRFKGRTSCRRKLLEKIIFTNFVESLKFPPTIFTEIHYSWTLFLVRLINCGIPMGINNNYFLPKFPPPYISKYHLTEAYSPANKKFILILYL